MKLLSIKAYGFMIMGSMEISLDNTGLVLIRGENKDSSGCSSNGSGKTTVCEALVWALWGKTIRGELADDVVLSGSKGGTEVILQFSDDSCTDTYEIRRYRKHPVYTNEVCLYMNGTDIRASSNQETQNKINALVKMDMQTFLASVMYGQGMSSSLKRFIDMSDGERKDIIDKIMGMDRFPELHNKTKSVLKGLKAEIASLSMEGKMVFGSIAPEKDTLAGLQKALSSAKKDKEDRIASRQAAITKYRETIAFIEGRLENAFEAEHLLVSLKKDRKSLQDGARDKLALLNKHSDELLREAGIVDNHINGLLNKAEEIDSFGGAKEVCPYCLSDIDFVKIEDRLREYSEERGLFETKLSEVEQEIKDWVSYTNKVKKDYNDKLYGVGEQITDCLVKVARISDHREGLALNKRNVDQAEEAIAKLVGEGGKEKEIQDLVDASRSKLDTAKKRYKQVSMLKSTLEFTVEKYDFWEYAFGPKGIRALLVKDVVTKLNYYVTKYINHLFDNSLSIRFKPTKELASGKVVDCFDVIINMGDKEVPYTYCSGGEKRRIDLAVMLALGDLVATRSDSRLNVLFLDEVFDALDDSGVTNVASLLSELSRQRDSIFVITHLDSMKDLFPNEMCVLREGGKSTVAF